MTRGSKRSGSVWVLDALLDKHAEPPEPRIITLLRRVDRVLSGAPATPAEHRYVRRAVRIIRANWEKNENIADLRTALGVGETGGGGGRRRTARAVNRELGYAMSRVLRDETIEETAERYGKDTTTVKRSSKWIDGARELVKTTKGLLAQWVSAGLITEETAEHRLAEEVDSLAKDGEPHPDPIRYLIRK